MLHRAATWAVATLLSAAALLPAPAAAGPIEDAFSKRTPGSTATVDHADWDALLKAFVTTDAEGLNRVAYARMKREAHPKLKAYIQRLQTVAVDKLDRPEQFAYWANLYNAKTIDIVLDKYPVASIKDISLGGGLIATFTGGPWKAKVLKVQGLALSLDDIEHVILRPLFKDPRVHYAVNCASIGCPNLGRDAFTGARLDAMLDAAAKTYVNSTRGARIENGQLTVSSIYVWFQADFGGSEKGVIAHLTRYALPELKSRLAKVTGIAGHTYDWRLNESKP